MIMVVSYDLTHLPLYRLNVQQSQPKNSVQKKKNGSTNTIRKYLRQSLHILQKKKPAGSEKKHKNSDLPNGKGDTTVDATVAGLS